MCLEVAEGEVGDVVGEAIIVAEEFPDYFQRGLDKVAGGNASPVAGGRLDDNFDAACRKRTIAVGLSDRRAAGTFTTGDHL